MSSQSSYSASQIHLLVHSSPKNLNIWHIKLKKKTLYNHLSIDVSEDVNGEVQFYNVTKQTSPLLVNYDPNASLVFIRQVSL